MNKPIDYSELHWIYKHEPQGFLDGYVSYLESSEPVKQLPAEDWRRLGRPLSWCRGWHSAQAEVHA